MATPFRLIDLAQLIVDDVNDLLDTAQQGLLTPDQIRESVGSISANIDEAYGRREGPERNQFFRYARGSARETRRRLRASFSRQRISPPRYWRIQNRIATLCKMLESLEHV